MNKPPFLVFLLSILVAALLCSCGGGTAGTGGSDLRVYDGRVLSSTSQPLSALNVRIDGSEDSSITDMNGVFQIAGAAEAGPVTFRLSGQSLSTSFTLDNVRKTDTHVAVTVMINENNDAVPIANYAARAGIVGACDHFFENGKDSIRQANAIPAGTQCTLKVRVYGDGQLLPNLPLGLQYSGCSDGNHWRELATARTGEGIHRGVSEFSFPFQSSPEFCRYRLLVPYKITNRWPLIFTIDTFESQARRSTSH